MTLKQWMALTDTSPEVAARKLRVHFTTIYRWLHAGRKPSIATALRVEKATGGAVTVRDW